MAQEKAVQRLNVAANAQDRPYSNTHRSSCPWLATRYASDTARRLEFVQCYKDAIRPVMSVSGVLSDNEPEIRHELVLDSKATVYWFISGKHRKTFYLRCSDPELIASLEHSPMLQLHPGKYTVEVSKSGKHPQAPQSRLVWKRLPLVNEHLRPLVLPLRRAEHLVCMHVLRIGTPSNSSALPVVYSSKTWRACGQRSYSCTGSGRT